MHALWMVLAALLFASMGVCVKLGSAYFHPAEMIFWRGIIGMVLLWVLARSQGSTLATAHPGKHAWRSFVGVVSLGTWFYAITQLPLATAVTLNYMSSVWIAAFLVAGSLWAWRRAAQGQRPSLQLPLVLTVLAGFAGVVLMLRPNIEQTPQQLLGGALGLLSGLTAAMAYMQVTHLSRMGEPESRTVFYFALGSALAGGAVSLVIGYSPWPGWHGLWLLPIGVLAALGQLCMTRAYGSARSAKGTLVVASLQYSGIVFASLYSVLLFGDRIPALGWLGMALIVGSGILATVLRARGAHNPARACQNPPIVAPRNTFVPHPLPAPPMPYSLLISAPELQTLLDSGTPCMVFDCSFDLADPTAGAQQFLQGHIPGAVYAHLDEHLSAPAHGERVSGGRHPLPTRETFAAWLAQQGFAAGMQAVVYDRNGSAFCGRLWWMLQWLGHEAVAVLDGGLQAWTQAGGTLEQGPQATRTPGTFQPGTALRPLATTAQVLQGLGTAGQTIIDARAPARYRGEVEPLDPVAGHIPGALNRPFTDNFGPDGRFKAPAQLRTEFLALLDGRDPITVAHHCGSGVTANPNVLAMELAGLGRAALYAGSWSEWCSDPQRPVERG